MIEFVAFAGGFILLLYIVVQITNAQDETLFYPGKYNMSPSGVIIGRGITFDNEVGNLFLFYNPIEPNDLLMKFRYKTERIWRKAAVNHMLGLINNSYVKYELIYEDKDDSFVFWEYTV